MTNEQPAAPRKVLLNGLLAATFTPMTEEGALDLLSIPAVCEFVLLQGADGLFVNGSTGECPSLTLEERRASAEGYVTAVAGRVPVVIHVGHNCLEDACALAAHAQQIGADAIAMVPPSYFFLGSMDSLVECLQKVAQAAPKMPLYYYHIPRITGVGIRMIDLLARASRELPSFAGVKFSSFELDDLLRCTQFSERRYNILFGADEMLLAGLVMGADGAVGSTYNFLGPYYQKVIEAFEAGEIEEARKHQHLATSLVHAILDHGDSNAIKASMQVLGVSCGPPRTPLVALNGDQMSSLRNALSSLIAGSKQAAGLPL